MTFRIALSNPSENSVTVTYVTADGTATAADNDYLPVVPTQVTFAPGETEKFVTIQINGDTKFESNEYFLVNLTTPVEATISTSSAAGTINNDDATPVVSINAAASNVEGNTGNKTITFTVTLDRASYQTVTVPFTVSNVDAVSGTDYTVVTSSPLTFNPGDTTATITINTIGDTIAEPDETFNVTLGTPTNATLQTGATVGVGTILNDDTIPAVSIGDTSVTEGTGGTTNITFTVTLSAMSSTPVTISYQTIAGTATDGADYTGTNTGTVTIAANALSQTFTIPITTDDLDEPDETFTVQLTGVTSGNATILNATGTGTILDDDATPVVSVTGPSGAVTEGSNVQFTVNLSSKSASPVVVTFTLVDGTAQGGTGKDYDNTTFTVTVPAGSTSQSFNIPTFDDLLDEGNETFTLTLQSATNATIDPTPANKSAMATIADNDAAPSLTAIVQTQPPSESGTIVYRVSLSAVSGQDVSFSYTLTGLATAGEDFTGPTSGTVTIPAGQSYVDILVPIVEDIFDEPNETVILTVTPGANANSTAPSPVTATITDDDDPPVISVSGGAVQEGNSPTTTTLAFTISLDKASGQQVTVNYATVDGTALAGTGKDYTAATGTVTFAPGETVKTVLVTVLGDNYDEMNETFTVSLSNPSNATVNPTASVATGTILDDDATPVVEIVPNPASVVEGNAITFTVQTVGGTLSDSPIVVTYSTSNGTAESGSDYTAGVLQTVTISAHNPSATFTIDTNNDSLNESSENFFVTLVSATNATVSTTANQATGEITDNDAAPTLSISDATATVTETPGGSVATFTVTLSTASGQPVTVDYATANGTALAGTDYAATSGTLTFAPSETSKTITVAVNDDTEYDPGETFVVNLTNATHATISDAQGTATITDNETAPVVTIGDVSRPEGNSGPTTYTFTVNLDRKSNETITLNYATTDDTATTANNDYLSSSGVVTFNPGDTSKTITVTVNGDGTVEPDETFTVTLDSTPVAGTINKVASDLSAIGTILNDDGAVFVSIADASVTEPSSGTATISFNVTLSAPSSTATTLTYTVGAGSTDAMADFSPALAGGTVTIPADQTSGQITFQVAADALDEADETFTVTLASVSAGTATILTGAKTATGTIFDNALDAPPVVSVSNTSVTETDANQTLAFTINMSAESGLPVTVSYTVLAGSGDTATPGSDFTPISGTVTINPGDTSATINIPILGDDLYEGDETFSVVLTGASNATIGSNPATVTIQDDDAAPTITIWDVTQDEGTGGVTTFYFPVKLSAVSGLDVAFDYTLTAGTAAAGVDFSAVGGHLVILAGQQSIMVPVNVVADAMDEIDEMFTVTLSNVTNVAGTGNDLVATGMITDDDDGPTISISDVTVTEGDGGTQMATFTVSLSGASGKTVTVNYATADGGAESGSDYTTTNGTLSFNAGVTSMQIQVPVLGDLVYEPNESFFVNLSNAVNGSIADTQGVGTIVNNDAVPNVSVTPTSRTVAEGNSGTTSVSFDIVLDRPSSTPITVTYTLVDGTATAADGDYAPQTGSVTFGVNETSKTVTLQVNGDTQFEGNEDFYFRVTGVTSGMATVPSGSNQGTVTITNDDAQPTIAIAPLTPSIVEGNSGSQVLTFTVTLSNASSQTVSVNYATADVNATAGSDYVATTGTLTFAPGETSKTISVLVNGDLIDEGDETFTVTLSNPSNATISAGVATATIKDNDLPPTLTVLGDSVTEGNSGTKSLTFTLTLSHPSADTITLVPSFTGTALSPTDYSYAGGNIVFNPGDLTKTLTVTVNGDLILEADETVGLTLTPTMSSGAVNVPSGAVNGTILNDDTYPAVSIGNASVVEGTGPGTTTLTFPVTLSAVYGEDITLSYSTIDGTAIGGTDFTGVSGGTVTITAGQLTGTIAITVNRDDLDEPDETLSVQLTGVTTGNAIILNGTGTGIIQDDDATPVVSISGPVSVTEGGTATFTVSLSSRSAEPVVVTLAVDNGTAQAPGDYTIPSPLTVTIPAGSLSAPFTVITVDDLLDEVSPETYSVRIVSATHSTVSTSANVAVGEIVDNDATPTVSLVGSRTASESAGTMSFTVQLSAISGQNVMVSYQVASGTATAGQDFTGMTGTVMIPAGSPTAKITVPIVNDLLNESNEDFTVTLTGATNATVSGGSVTGTIEDDNDALPVVTVSGGQATEGPGAAVVFTITLASASGQNVTVPYTIVPGTATAADYDTSGLSGSVTFTPGQTTATVTVPVIDDLLDEAVETFSLNLGTPTNATLGTPNTALGTIYDNDTAPVVSVVANPTTVTEGTGGTVVYNFTISLDAPSGQPVTVNYTTGALTDTATAGSDYTPISGTVTFTPGGSTSITVPVTITTDAFDELNETLSLRLTGASNATISGLNNVATVTIVDDDATPTVNIANASLTEGDTGAQTLTFTVSLSAASNLPITMNYATADVNATAGWDYVATTGTLTFAPGETSKTISVLVNGDLIDEGDETFTVTLSGITNATAGTITGTGTIKDNDTATISVSDVSVLEGNAGTTAMTFNVTLSTPSSQTVTVTFGTGTGTATAGTDYTAIAGQTVTFAPGDTSKPVTVTVQGDTTFEQNETVPVTLSGASGATILNGNATGTIVNDDLRPTITVTPVNQSVTEGAGSVSFTVSLSNASDEIVNVDYSTLDGSALAGLDYTAVSGTLTFNPGGPLSQVVTVTINDDNIDELPESLSLLLSNPVNGTLANVQGSVQISDNDDAPVITLNPATVTTSEGNSGTTGIPFTVTLSNPSSQTVTVAYATSDVLATAGSDYTGISGTLVFQPGGPLTQTVTVFVSGDTTFEPDETFALDLSSPTNGTLGVSHSTVTIQDDDPIPTLNVSSVTQDEGDSGTTAFVFTLTLTNASHEPIVVNYATADGTATSAGSDYQAAMGTLTFAPDETTKTVTVLVNGDLTYEGNETFALNVTPVSGQVTIGTAGQGTITNDDPVPTVAITNVTANEGDSGNTPFTFAVTLSNPTDQTVTINYTTIDDSAIAGSDYTAQSGTLTFNPGVTSQFVTVLVTGDNSFEPDEVFHVELSGATNAVIPGGGTISATGTITNDDTQPALTINDVTVVEGNSGTTPATFVLSLSHPSSNPVTISYSTADTTAAAGTDYTATTGTVIFAPGETTKTVTVPVIGDTVYESDETFMLNVSSPDSSALVPDTFAVGTITNDEAIPVITINSVTQTEGTGGTTPFTFTVQLSGPSQTPITVDYVTADGTASEISDYTRTTGRLTFAPGETSKTVTVLVNADNLGENDETFTVSLLNPVGANLLTSTGTGTIVNDDIGTDLVVTVTDGVDQLGAARSPVYTVTVTNRGPTGVTGARVLESFTGADLTYVTWTASATGGASAVTAGNGPIDQIVDIPAGGAITYIVRATVQPGAVGTLTHTVSVTPPAGITEVAPANNTATDADKLITRLVAVGASAGGGPRVRVYNSDGTLRFNFFAYEDTQRGGVTVATGDVNGDGVDDIVTGAGVGGGPRVRVFDGVTGSILSDFFAYEDTQRGGVFVAVGDVNGDGIGEVITGAGMGGGPRVRVFDGRTGQPTNGIDFFAYDANFRNGVRVAAGDTNGDGIDEIITGAGDGGSAHVIVWTPAATLEGVVSIASYFAYDPDYSQFRNGVFVAAGDVNGDGLADVITGPGSGGQPLVRVFNGKNNTQITEFLAYDQGFLGGVRVSDFDSDGDGISDSIFTGAGGKGGGQVRAYRLLPNGTILAEETGIVPFETSYELGVYVG
ncbi:MAG: hypothetical protein LC104_03960 [Bacteroidales bacterium]|nr:hypothetical protein [Bacteroidales bacterium]